MKDNPDFWNLLVLAILAAGFAALALTFAVIEGEPQLIAAIVRNIGFACIASAIAIVRMMMTRR